MNPHSGSLRMAIKKVAVLGAGVMGQGIAAHLANAGIASLPKLKPAALYRASDVSRITPCEYEADKGRLAECDVIIEVVAEILPIKKKVFAWVAENRKPGSIVSSNTSGIP